MRFRWWLLSMCVFFSAAAAQPLTPSTFAYGMQIEFEDGNALVEVTLPPDVYRAATRADLGDIRVFNGADEVVPHVLRVLPAPSVTYRSHTPPMFPVYANEGETAAAVVMTVRRDAQGRISSVETRRAQNSTRRIVAYIVDASAVTAPLTAVELDWNGEATDFLGTISLQQSEDLTRWSDVVTDAGIASMSFGAERLERRRVEFSARRAKYYRVLWPASKPLPDLPVIKFDEAGVAAGPVRLWEKVTPRRTDTGTYTFELPGRFPADQVRMQLLPQTNRVVQATLSTREHASQPWTRAGAGSVYRLNFGTLMLESPALALARVASREWMLQLTPPEGLENVEPVLEFGWTPHRLVFVASGSGPFRLAYGAANVGPFDGSLSGVLVDVEKNSAQSATQATLGSQEGLGGSERLSLSSTANWRTWVLWTTLLAAVGLLAWMAWRLRKRLAASEPDQPK